MYFLLTEWTMSHITFVSTISILQFVSTRKIPWAYWTNSPRMRTSILSCLIKTTACWPSATRYTAPESESYTWTLSKARPRLPPLRKKKKKEYYTEISVPETEVDFGTCDWQKEHTAVFKIRNTGQKLLVIHNVELSCGCLEADYTKKPARPGEELEVRITFKATNTGYFRKVAFVRCNTKEQMLRLYVSGDAVWFGREHTVPEKHINCYQEKVYPEMITNYPFKFLYLSPD